MRISDWSSDVCSSDLCKHDNSLRCRNMAAALSKLCACVQVELEDRRPPNGIKGDAGVFFAGNLPFVRLDGKTTGLAARKRSEEHTSELQSLMRISYAVFCLKKKKNTNYKSMI